MAHADVLEQRDSLRKPFLGSVAMHLFVFVTLALYSYLANRGRELWGDPNSLGGGAVGITPVSKIPLPGRAGLVNPVANDTESRVPQPPPKAQEQEKAEPEVPDAIPIKSRRAQKRRAEIAASRLRYRPEGADKPNQVYSSSGKALTSPMYGQTSGTGGVAIGGASPFGSRYGYYEQLLREKVARYWHTNEVDARLQTAPPVVVTFEILRNGSIRSVQVLQRSGNYALDMSAQRAIVEASPFEPLPAGFERDSAKIEFWFILKR